MTTRAEVVACARTWLRTPYKHQASVKGVGADCSGLLRGIGAELGLAVRSRVDYARSPSRAEAEEFLAAVRENLVEIPVADARAGDVLLVWFEAEDLPYHFLLVTEVRADRTMILHTYSTVGLVVETVLSKAWRDHIHSAWLIPALEDA